MRSIALALGVGAVIAFWSFLVWPQDAPDGQGGSFADGQSLGLLIFSVYLFVPWGVLAFRARSLTPVGRGVAVVLTMALTVGMYVTIWTSDSSTAALGFLWLPLYQGLAIGAVIALQRLRGRNAAV